MIILLFFSAAGESSAEISGKLLSALQSNDNLTRASAVEEVGRLRGDEAVTVLMNVVAIKEEDWRIRIKAIRLLGEIGNPRAADLLLEVYANPFMNEECPAIKWTTTLALGNFRDNSRVIDALIEALHYDNIIVREAAIQSLGKLRASEAVPLMIKALGDKSFAIRISAVTALGKIGNSKAIPHLKKIAESADDPLIKSEALSALSYLK